MRKILSGDISLSWVVSTRLWLFQMGKESEGKLTEKKKLYKAKLVWKWTWNKYLKKPINSTNHADIISILYTLFPIQSMNFLEAPDPSISYNLIGKLKSVQLIEVIKFYLRFLLCCRPWKDKMGSLRAPSEADSGDCPAPPAIL